MVYFQIDTSHKLSLAFFIAYFASMIMEIGFLCYFGACLVDKSDRLSEKLFHSHWIEQNQQFKRRLFIFMQGLRNSIAIFAGGLFRVDLRTCLSVRRIRNVSSFILLHYYNLNFFLFRSFAQHIPCSP